MSQIYKAAPYAEMDDSVEWTEESVAQTGGGDKRSKGKILALATLGSNRRWCSQTRASHNTAERLGTRINKLLYMGYRVVHISHSVPCV